MGLVLCGSRAEGVGWETATDGGQTLTGGWETATGGCGACSTAPAQLKALVTAQMTCCVALPH